MATMKGGRDVSEKIQMGEVEKLRYSLTQVPHIHFLISAALQHIMMNLAYTLTAAFIVSDVVCAAYDSPLRTRLFSSALFMSGVCTLLQTAFGIRLPVYQGPSASFFPALIALKNNMAWKCHEGNSTDASEVQTSVVNTSAPSVGSSLTEGERLQQLSGSLMASSLFEILIGATGLVGFLLRYIGPVTVGPTIALIGLSLYKIPIALARPSWEITFGGMALVLIFALYISHVKIPLPVCGKKKRSYLQLFQLLPVLLAILVMWAICGVLTYTDVFPNDQNSPRYRARTDAKKSLVELTPWFIFPYPGQFGLPSFSIAAFVGFMTGFCASMIESVGDYFAAAKACNVDPPPDHAVNRGILMEGLAGLIGGSIGTAHATTSYSGNISTLIITKTASRSVMLCCGVLLLGFAVLGKFGAALSSLPDPALAGVLVILCGMLASLGLSTLRHVNMNSSRNQLIVGVALFLGIFLPEWVDRYPDFINTGIPEVDGVLKVALGTPMFVGGVFSIILDNTVRGSREERGLTSWRQSHHRPSGTHEPSAASEKDISSSGDNIDDSVTVEEHISITEAYEWRVLPSVYKRMPCLARLPFMPSLHVNESAIEDKESNDVLMECSTRV